MRIEQIDVYGYGLHYRYGSYAMSGGRTIAELASTVVRLTTDDGLVGWGEVCPLGATYLPAHAEGARAALREMAPALLGADPREISSVRQRMDRVLRGHDYAKSPVDIACWDLLGKATGCSVATLLGGRQQPDFPLYEAVPLGSRDEMADFVLARRAEGIHQFQMKVGADPYADAERVRHVVDLTGNDDIIIADANGGWRLQDAMVVARLIEPLPRVYLEQPCATLNECLYVRQHTHLPMVLDEVIPDVPSLLHAFSMRAMEAFNLKISKVGGLTQAKLMRDVADSLGLRVTIEDTWGGDVTAAAVSHLAASTRPETLFTVSFMNDWVVEHIAGYHPRSQDGRGSAPDKPGLGIDVDLDQLGAALYTFRA